MDERPLLVIVGPTAGGKTALSLTLAERLPGGGACLCADSMQVYRGMDIGTAKPTREERGRAPHHLLDLVEPGEDGFTVERWRELAEAAIREVRARGGWPIVVGGTNLYVKALLEGLMEGPPPDDELRRELATWSNEALWNDMARVDPVAAERIHVNDRKRMIRAVEVHRRTGRPLSEQQAQWDRGSVRGDARIIGLDYPAEAINRRINARVKAMIEAGLVEEVRSLHERGAFGRQAREALGYKQIIEHLEGRSTLEEAIEAVKIRTRRYAKQQRTWLRRFRAWPGGRWLEAEGRSARELAEDVIAWLDGHPDQPREE